MTIPEEISQYLQTGGLFNPELANHDAVRDLLIRCRDEIEELKKERDSLQFWGNSSRLHVRLLESQIDEMKEWIREIKKQDPTESAAVKQLEKDSK